MPNVRAIAVELITALIDEWVRSGDRKYLDAAEEIITIMKDLSN